MHDKMAAGKQEQRYQFSGVTAPGLQSDFSTTSIARIRGMSEIGSGVEAQILARSAVAELSALNGKQRFQFLSQRNAKLATFLVINGQEKAVTTFFDLDLPRESEFDVHNFNWNDLVDTLSSGTFAASLAASGEKEWLMENIRTVSNWKKFQILNADNAMSALAENGYGDEVAQIIPGLYQGFQDQLATKLYREMKI